MNINDAIIYLGKAHMNRKVANYLILVLTELQSKVNEPAELGSFLTKKYHTGYEDCKRDIRNILNKED